MYNLSTQFLRSFVQPNPFERKESHRFIKYSKKAGPQTRLFVKIDRFEQFHPSPTARIGKKEEEQFASTRYIQRPKHRVNFFEQTFVQNQ